MPIPRLVKVRWKAGDQKVLWSFRFVSWSVEAPASSILCLPTLRLAVCGLACQRYGHHLLYKKSALFSPQNADGFEDCVSYFSNGKVRGMLVLLMNVTVAQSTLPLFVPRVI